MSDSFCNDPNLDPNPDPESFFSDDSSDPDGKAHEYRDRRLILKEEEENKEEKTKKEGKGYETDEDDKAETKEEGEGYETDEDEKDA
uniref:Uncharacterized protein n=1 Tax=Solanum tuberosum TaxID=4113 RepID=M0ZX90_SOLTU